jgi:hypothetical protein
MTDGFIVPCYNESLANDCEKERKEAIKEKKG